MVNCEVGCVGGLYLIKVRDVTVKKIGVVGGGGAGGGAERDVKARGLS